MNEEDPEEHRTELAEERTELSAERTRDAIERTLMAWIRTTLGMIGFGFGLFKLFQTRPEQMGAAGRGVLATKSITLALVALGTLLLVAAMAQYRSALKRLRHQHPRRDEFPLAFIAAAAIAFIGLFALVDLLFRWGGS